MITWITRNVAIGEYSDAINKDLLKKEQIDCILCLRTVVSNEEDALKEFLEIPLFHVAVGDHQGLEPIKIELKTATYMLEELTDRYAKILVHCTAGADRAPFVVTYWLANKEYYTLHNIKDQMIEAYKDVKKKRPQIIEHMEWI